jgi:hypothetical protein
MAASAELRARKPKEFGGCELANGFRKERCCFCDMAQERLADKLSSKHGDNWYIFVENQLSRRLP